jgi:hypothetical protein
VGDVADEQSGRHDVSGVEAQKVCMYSFEDAQREKRRAKEKWRQEMRLRRDGGMSN